MKQKMNFAQISHTALLLGIIVACFAAARAQTTAFTYQGRFTDSTVLQPTNGTYQMQFALFDAASAPVGAAITVPSVRVVNGIFTVNLDFSANAFPVNAERSLEIRVFNTATSAYVPLSPRQPINAAPYAIRSLNATTADNALNVGGTPAAQIINDSDARLTDARTPTAGSANYVQNATTEQTSTDFNISGGGTANIFNARTQFNIGGSRVFIASGNNLSAGFNSGNSFNPTGGNSFFGTTSGQVNTIGNGNAFFGTGSGQRNTTGGGNVFFGNNAGAGNISGKENSFVGISAGINSKGDYNTFFGGAAGFYNVSGSYNTYIGWSAGTYPVNIGNRNTLLGAETSLASGNLQYATAIGAGATVGDSNSVVLGRTSDTVRIPGTLNVNTFTAATLSANTVNADTQFNIGGERVFSASGFNTFVGLFAGGGGGGGNSFFGYDVGRFSTGNFNSFFGTGAGYSNLSGSENSFFGRSAGAANTSGLSNSFFGLQAGARNTIGSDNSFFGWQAGYSNTTGSGNSFFGRNAGFGGTGSNNVFFGLNTGTVNRTGSNNTLVGSLANVGSNALTFATALGSGAVVSDSNTVVLGRTADTVIAPNLLQVNALGAAGDTSLCRNSLNQISNCTAGNLAEKNLAEQNTATANALREQKAQIERQQRQIDELKKIVCLLKPDAAVCQ